MRPHFQTRFDIAEFRRRREALSNAIDGHVAVVGGLPASGAMDPFRQDNVFFYLSGVEVPHSYLVIGKAGESTLYLPPVDKRLAEIEGPELDAEDQALTLELTGFDHVKPLTALSSDLRAESVLYTPRDSAEGRRACQDSLSDSRRRAERDPWQRSQPTLASLLHARLGPIELRDLSPAVARLRKLKSSVEMEALREAGQITSFAIKEAIRSTQPGLVEYQLAALAEYTFTLNGAAGGAYQPIVASGSNIWNIHYARNNCRLQEGDLVLMDYAPDLNYYTSDIGRMWPVNGVYSKEQRETLSLIVDYHQTLLNLIGPGMTARELRDLAADKLRPIVSRTKWSSEPVKNAVETLLATSRACTHDVGMAVHDSSGYQSDDEILEPGMVFALDPQFWIPEHRLYQRVEDNIAITSDGVENFTSDAPIALDQIEQLMLEPGILQRDTHLFAGLRSEPNQ